VGNKKKADEGAAGVISFNINNKKF